MIKPTPIKAENICGEVFIFNSTQYDIVTMV